MEQFGEHDKDFGNSAVQIAVLTERVFALSHHLRLHRTDKRAYFNLTLLLNRRRKMALYLYRTNYHSYRYVMDELNLRDIVPDNHKSDFRCRNYRRG